MAPESLIAEFLALGVEPIPDAAQDKIKIRPAGVSRRSLRTSARLEDCGAGCPDGDRPPDTEASSQLPVSGRHLGPASAGDRQGRASP
jgi:hypothetical protein